MNTYSMELTSRGKKYAIIVARFNDFINQRLLAGAKDGLIRHGVKEEEISVYYVPGAFEIPLVAQKVAKDFDAVITLGTVIRGATSHYDTVVNEVSKGVAAVSLATETPVLFGVLTVESIEQAIERAGTKAGNKGFDVAVNAIEMANLVAAIDSNN